MPVVDSAVNKGPGAETPLHALGKASEAWLVRNNSASADASGGRLLRTSALRRMRIGRY